MRTKIILSLGILVLLSIFFSRLEPGSSFLGSSASAQDVLESLEQNITGLVESVKPSLVTIEAGIFPEAKGRSPQLASFVGSGVIYSPDGYILTTSSVVRGMKDFRVIGSDKKEYEAKLIGTDYQTNLAVLKIDAKGLRPAELGNSDKTKEGSWVTVVGNSYGLPTAVSFGIVNGIRDDKTIQMSVNVSPGNSGGPVLNTRGKVIGLVSAKLSEPSVIGSMRLYEEALKRTYDIPATQIEIPSSGISLAIPINQVKEKADYIIKHGSSIEKGFLGVYLEDLDDDTREELKINGGVLISGVVEKSPADKAGLKDEDVVIEFNGEEVRDAQHFTNLIENSQPGKSIKLKVIREGEEQVLTARLGRSGETYSYFMERTIIPQIKIPEINIPEIKLQYDEAKGEYDKEQAETLKELEKTLNKSLDNFKKELERLSKELEKLDRKMKENKK